MEYYLNITTKKLHNEHCGLAKYYVNHRKLSSNWIIFGSFSEAKKHCKKDGRQYRYCDICCGKDGGKIVQ